MRRVRRRTSRRSRSISTRSACRIGWSPGLVRGLDYYTRTAFEYYRRGREGQQQALGGGGRYDGLVELLGGKHTPGIGFALGLDRVVLALEEVGAEIPAEAGPIAVVVGADPGATAERLRVATDLRAEGLSVRADLGRPQARATAGVGRAGKGRTSPSSSATSCPRGNVQLRDLEAASQKVVAIDDLPALLLRKSQGRARTARAAATAQPGRRPAARVRTRPTLRYDVGA